LSVNRQNFSERCLLPAVGNVTTHLAGPPLLRDTLQVAVKREPPFPKDRFMKLLSPGKVATGHSGHPGFIVRNFGNLRGQRFRIAGRYQILRRE
jgi:muramidase (phage lysozyme)